MIGYFKPLRRKLGILTLAVASFVLVGWVRSVSTLDLVILAGKSSNRILVSGSQKFRIIDASQYRLVEAFVQDESNHHFNTKVIPVATFISYPHFINWHSRPATNVGIYGGYKDSQPQVEMIPYLWVAIPLTLLTAWLLISKPRLVKRSTTAPSAAH